MKPVYNGAGFKSTAGKEYFDQWYNTVEGVNMATQISIELIDTDGDGVYTYSNNAFFPIDNQLFENEGRPHNYHFTFELHTKFTYVEGQTFSFTGDDDIWVFINFFTARGPRNGTHRSSDYFACHSDHKIQ